MTDDSQQQQQQRRLHKCWNMSHLHPVVHFGKYLTWSWEKMVTHRKLQGRLGFLKQAPVALFQIQFKYFSAGRRSSPEARNCLTLTLGTFSASSQPQFGLMWPPSSETVGLNYSDGQNVSGLWKYVHIKYLNPPLMMCTDKNYSCGSQHH